MKSEARALYWEFALRLATRTEVASWADQTIVAGHQNEELFDLSTCAGLDDNDVMRLLADVSIGYDKIMVEQRLIAKLIAHYSTVDTGMKVNASLLSDYEQIEDISSDVRSELMWLSDEIALSREGAILLRAHEAQLISQKMSKVLADMSKGNSRTST